MCFLPPSLEYLHAPGLPETVKKYSWGELHHHVHNIMQSPPRNEATPCGPPFIHDGVNVSAQIIGVRRRGVYFVNGTATPCGPPFIHDGVNVSAQIIGVRRRGHMFVNGAV